MNRWKLEFHSPAATLAQLRAYLARLVGEGAWDEVSREDTRTTWRLGAATLLETLTEDRGERPGSAFIIDVVATWPARDGSSRLVRFGGWFSSLEFRSVHLELEGFSPAEFQGARARGAAHFGTDATVTLPGARDNVRHALRVGERALALRLLDEALAAPQRADQQHLKRELEVVRAELGAAPVDDELPRLLARRWHSEGDAAALVDVLRARGAVSEARVVCEDALVHPHADAPWAALRRLRRARAELAWDDVARGLAERDALLGEPTDFARLAEVASGARPVRDWKPEAARRVLAMMRPWLPESAVELGAVAQRWLQHPWWGGSSLEGWVTLRHRSGVREPAWLTFDEALAALRRALRLGDVPIGDGVAYDLVETERLVVRAVTPKLRAVLVHGDEPRWAWLWAGGLEGAVLVSGPKGTQLTWLGDEQRFGSHRASLSREVKKLLLQEARE